MPKKMRVGMIGCGMIAQILHVPDYAFVPEAEIAALCDIVPQKAHALAKKWAPDAAVYKDYKKMLREAHLDAVTVALPNNLHCQVTVDALKAGCHVNVEKPMAASSAEAQRMVDAAKKAGKLLNVNQCQRLYPAIIKAKEVITSGLMGRILHVTAMFGHRGPEHWSPTGKWFFKKKQARFGAMADLGVHVADKVRYLTGKEVAEIGAFAERLEKKHSDVEDNFVSCLKFDDGTVGTLSSSWTVKGYQASYIVMHCENGTLRIQDDLNKPLVGFMVKPHCKIVFDPPPPIVYYPGSWGVDASGAFVRAAMGLIPPYCPGDEGKKSLEIILAAEKAAKTGRAIKLG